MIAAPVPAVFRWASVLAAALAVAACGGTSQAPSSSSSATSSVRQSPTAQATQLCTNAFAAPAPATDTPGRGPLDSFQIDDTANLPAQIQTGTESEWMEIPGEPMVAGVHAAQSSDPGQLNSVVCIRRTYEIVGDYVGDGPSAKAARRNYDARLVDWHSGTVLAARHFDGPDPGQKAFNTNPNLIVAGDGPDTALGQWLNGLVS
jgi:hypothetical protein